jgi:hypothetical protein
MAKPGAAGSAIAFVDLDRNVVPAPHLQPQMTMMMTINLHLHRPLLNQRSLKLVLTTTTTVHDVRSENLSARQKRRRRGNVRQSAEQLRLQSLSKKERKKMELEDFG